KPFSLWVVDPVEVKSLTDLVIAKTFNFSKDFFHYSFGDDTTPMRSHSGVYFVSMVVESDIPLVKIDCGWEDDVDILPPSLENILSLRQASRGVYLSFLHGIRSGTHLQPHYSFVIKANVVDARWDNFLLTPVVSKFTLYYYTKVRQKKACGEGVQKKKKRKDTISEFSPSRRGFKRSRGKDSLEKITATNKMHIDFGLEVLSFRDVLFQEVEVSGQVTWLKKSSARVEVGDSAPFGVS
ncbi:hypothetical protein HAX54_025307, partial [Datura stramonium]|nr:hypothetical protein [Datura stramonium]